jgi:hypothetical protein
LIHLALTSLRNTHLTPKRRSTVAGDGENAAAQERRPLPTGVTPAPLTRGPTRAPGTILFVDHEPGYPVDHRTDSMRERRSRSHLGDFELAAARVVARLTGERVVLQDDNSAHGMVDIRIDHRDRAPGYVEVVTDIDPAYSAMADLVRGQNEIPAADLGRVWFVTVSAKAHVRTLTRDLPERLHGVQQSGALFEIVHWQQHLDGHPSDQVRELAALGVVRLASRPVQPDEAGRILLSGEGTGGPAALDWAAFDDWLTDYLHDHLRADVRRKLAATGVTERHVFIGVSFSTRWAAYHALSDDYCGLPDRPPRLPVEVTHLWVWSYPVGRCIAWFPDTGWLDPVAHWATN